MNVARKRLLLAASLAMLCACATPPAVERDDTAVAPWLVDIGESSGVDFRHRSGAAGTLHLREIVSGGAALLDADGDGRLDLYFSNGEHADGSPAPGRLYLQREDGGFHDATGSAGLEDEREYGISAAVGDVDNDGDEDLYLSNDGADRLYLNRGDGSFADATAAAGIDVDGLSCSAVLCDYDRDGLLDIYVTRYVRHVSGQRCSNSAGQADYCSPRAYNPERDVLLHNEGGARFKDVSLASGIGVVAAAGLGVVCEDLDGDGFPDFYVANDGYANYLWINRRDGTFVDRALVSGSAYNMEGRAEAGMGVIAEDLDGDLQTDLFVTHLGGETNTLYRGLGGGLFQDAGGEAGLAQSSLATTGFGVVALDVEGDGDRDLFVANGRVFRGSKDARSEVAPPWDEFAEPNLFYLNTGGGRFALEARLAAPFTEARHVSRALAKGDIDNDGDLDLVVARVEARPAILRNDAPRAGHWLQLALIDPRLRRHAIGALVIVRSGERRMLGRVGRGQSYLASHDPRLHFGLGDAAADELEVLWPDGLRERFPAPAMDRLLTLRRGDGEPL